MRPSALSSVMLARTDRLTPFPLITSLQPQHFHTIAHSFAQRRSVIPSISNSFRTLLMLTGGGTPRDAQSFNHNSKRVRLAMSSRRQPSYWRSLPPSAIIENHPTTTGASRNHSQSFGAVTRFVSPSFASLQPND